MDDYSQEASEYQMSEAPPLSQSNFEHLWKKNDKKAQKNGPHRSIYWVTKKKTDSSHASKTGASSLSESKQWVSSSRYIGDWKENMKEGFGIQIYKNGDKYEGLWSNNFRHGQGTYWRNEGGKLKREYTGDWFEDRRHGRGTFFYKNGDRYDGFWVQGKPQGEGRIIYDNQDIYEGQWHEGKKSGYGVLVKKNGDHFEGHWVNDKKEGQGSYLFAEKNKLFVGEWVDDNPKCGIYTEVEDEDAPPRPAKPHFMDEYYMPAIPGIRLENPTEVLEKAMDKTKKDRSRYRAQYIPIDEMFTPQELEDLQQAFDAVAKGESEVNMLSLKTLFAEMGIFPTDEMLNDLLKSLGKESEDDEISFELYARAVALLLEENSKGEDQSEIHHEYENESPMKSGQESDINMAEYQQEYSSQHYDN